MIYSKIVKCVKQVTHFICNQSNHLSAIFLGLDKNVCMATVKSIEDKSILGSNDVVN